MRGYEMLFLVIFLLLGGASYMAQRATVPLLVAAASVPLMYVLVAFTWANDKLGTSTLMINSWQFLSGSQTPGGIVQNSEECGSLLSLVMILLTLAVLLLLLVFGLVSVIAVPVGVVAGVVGSITSLFTRTAEPFLKGMACLMVGVGSVIGAGVTMRLAHIFSGIGC